MVTVVDSGEVMVIDVIVCCELSADPLTSEVVYIEMLDDKLNAVCVVSKVDVYVDSCELVTDVNPVAFRSELAVSEKVEVKLGPV